MKEGQSILAKRIAYCCWGAFFSALFIGSFFLSYDSILVSWWARSWFGFGLALGWFMGLFAGDKSVSESPFPFLNF